MDSRHLDRLSGIQLRQDRWQPLGQHRLAGARCAFQQQVVRAGRSDFERPTRNRLADHLDQVGQHLAGLHGDRIGGRKHRALRAQRPHYLGQRGRDQHPQPGDHRCLAGIADRHHDGADPEATRGKHCRQRSPDRPEPAVEAEFAEPHDAGHRRKRHLAGRPEHSHRQRQVEHRTVLAQIGRQ